MLHPKNNNTKMLWEKKIMKKTILALLLSVLMITSLFAQVYSENGPSNTADSNVMNVTLIGENSSINYTPTAAVMGLDNQTALVATLIAGNSYDVSVTWGDITPLYTYSGVGSVWIDWNSDGTFAESELIGDWAGTPEAIETYNFTVPTDFTGSTRMRVMQEEGGSLPLDATASFTWGSNMDFTITLFEAGAPDAPTLTSPANGETLVAIDTDLEWTTGANTDHTVLYIADNLAFTDATVVDPATSPYTVSLESGTTYYWKVVAVSATSAEMASSVYSFTTALGAGNFVFELLDSYGDGWNGAAMDVLVDDEVVLDDITVATGSFVQFVINVEQGQTITSDFHTNGSYPGECSFNLYDHLENLLASGNSSTEINYTVPLPGTPATPYLESPADGSLNLPLISDLEWTSEGTDTDGFTLYLSESIDFTGAVPVDLDASDLLYTTSNLTNNTMYYWKVVAVNNETSIETSSEVWSFTTAYGEASVPFMENFDTYASGDNLNGWITVNTTGNANATTRVSTSYPVSAPNSYYMTNSTVSSGGSLIVSTPLIENSGNRVRFYARGASAGYVLYVGTMTDPTDDTTFTRLDSLNLTNTQTQYIVDLPSEGGLQHVAFKHGLGGTSRSIYLDNVNIEEIPTAAVIEFSPEAVDCGTYLEGDTTAVAQTVTISNVGAVSAEITEIVVGHPSYFEVINENTLPYILEPETFITVDVKALTAFVGVHDSYLRVKEKLDLFTFINHDIDITTEIISTTGDEHTDPFTLVLADQIVEQNTTSIYNQTYSFCTGPSVVYKLTLPQAKVMDISLEGTEWDTKLFVFNSFDQIDTATTSTDAWYYNDDETSAGTGGRGFIEEVKTRDRALWSKMNPSFAPAGDYYIVVTGYGSNNGPFTMTINTENIPAPAAASNPYPSDDAVDLSTNFTVTWDNADYTETVDIYFGQVGSMVQVETDIPAVEEYPLIGLTPNTEYEWKIVNRNYAGETPALDVVTWSFTTIGNAPDSTEYIAPADDAVDVAVNGNLTWQAVDGADGYNVYLATDSLFAGVTPIDQTGTSYTYSAEYGQTYYWKVIPYNAVGPATGIIEVWSFTIVSNPFPRADIVFDGPRNTSQGLPMNPYYPYTTTQSIYYQSELDFEDSYITSISYLFNNNSAFTEEIDIYMGHTIKNTFADSYDWDLDEMTLVYSGDLSTTTSDPVVNIELDTPFIYDNVNNLVVTFIAKESGAQGSSDDFYSCSVNGNRSISNSGYTYYPLLSGNIPYGTMKAYLPVTGFNYQELPLEPVFTVNADTLTFTDQIMDEVSDPQTVTVSNLGISDLGLVSTTISGTNADQFQLTDENTYQVTLATGENMSVQVAYAPTTEGNHRAQLVITDDQARVIHTVELVGNSIDTNIYTEDLPWNDSFEGDLYGWLSIVESTSTFARVALNTSATNVQDGSNAIEFYNSSDASANLQLITPNIVPDMDGYRLRFWTKGPLNSEMILGKYDTELNVLTAIDTFDVPLTYEQRTIEFEGTTTGNERFAFIPVFANTSNYIYLDNITFEETPLTPVAELSSQALDFGEVEVATTSVAEEVTITNVGPGTLNISNVEITGTDAGLFAWDYVDETPDMALDNGESLAITVTFTPDALGLKEATLAITDDLARNVRISSSSKASNNNRAVNEVALTGSGWLPPQGSTCADPIPLTFPAVDVTGNTIDFIDDYSSSWISPSSSYMNGDDVVYQFTLANSMLLNGTITTTGSWIGAFILADEPNETTPAEVLLTKSTSSNSLTYTNEMIPAGTYFLIISSYPAPQSIDYTINLTADPLPAPEVATSPSPADGDIDQLTDLTLTWNNADYTETVDLWFGPTPEPANSRSLMATRSMVKVLDNVAAVEEYAVTDLDPNTEYSWKVICRNYTGETIADSVVTWTFTTVGSAPEPVTYTAPADEATNVALSGSLTWSAATGADGYYVYFSTDETFASVTPEDEIANYYDFSGLDYETTYYWKVIPYNVIGQATGNIEVWSFTTIPDPSIPMPVAIDFEGSTTNPAAITSENFNIGIGAHNTVGYVMYKNIYSTATNGYILFQSMNNIPASAVISLDYRMTDWSAGTVGITSVEGHDYLSIYASTDNGASFDPVDAVNGTDHVDSAEFATFTADISAYAGQSVIFRFEMEDDGVNDYWFDIDNIYFGEPMVTDPEVPVNFVISNDGASITITWDVAANANSYNIYGCDTPDGEYVLLESIAATGHTFTATEPMKFYKVKASTDTISPAKRFGRN